MDSASSKSDGDEYTVRITESSIDQAFGGPFTVDADGPVEAVFIAPASHRPENTYTVGKEADGTETDAPEEELVTDADVLEYIETAIGRVDAADYMYMLYPVADRDDDVSRRVAEAVADQYDEAWVAYGDGTSYYVPPTEKTPETIRELADELFLAKQDYRERFRADVTLGIELEVDPSVDTARIKQQSTTAHDALIVEKPDGEGLDARIPLGVFDAIHGAEIKDEQTHSTGTTVFVEAHVETTFSVLVETETPEISCRKLLRDEVENQQGQHATTLKSVTMHSYEPTEDAPEEDPATAWRRVQKSITSLRERFTTTG